MAKHSLAEELKNELSRNYETYVRIVAKLRHTSKDKVREAFHDVACRMLTTLAKRPGALKPVTAWRPYLIEAIVNELKDKRRQVARRKRTRILFSELDAEGREKLMNVPDPHATPAEQAEQNDLATLARRELDALPSYQRDVIARRCDGEPFDRIAERMSIASSTARAYWTRGLAALRQRLRAAA